MGLADAVVLLEDLKAFTANGLLDIAQWENLSILMLIRKREERVERNGAAWCFNVMWVLFWVFKLFGYVSDRLTSKYCLFGSE